MPLFPRLSSFPFYSFVTLENRGTWSLNTLPNLYHISPLDYHYTNCEDNRIDLNQWLLWGCRLKQLWLPLAQYMIPYETKLSMHHWLCSNALPSTPLRMFIHYITSYDTLVRACTLLGPWPLTHLHAREAGMTRCPRWTGTRALDSSRINQQGQIITHTCNARHWVVWTWTNKVLPARHSNPASLLHPEKHIILRIVNQLIRKSRWLFNVTHKQLTTFSGCACQRIIN